MLKGFNQESSWFNDHTVEKMPDANGMILNKEEENDAEVRREDQDQINEFGQLNARLHEVRNLTKWLRCRPLSIAACP